MIATARLWYYGSLAKIFLERLPGPLSYELDRTVTLLKWYVSCGGIDGAKSSAELVWHEEADGFTAIGRGGTHWETSRSSDRRYAITVARWDRPDWYTDTLNDAKQLCDELDLRPPFWAELMEPEWIPPD